MDVKQHGNKKKEKHLGLSRGRGGGWMPPLTSACVCVHMCVCLCVCLYVCVFMCVCKVRGGVYN